ncbi:TPA: hypothetical protein R4G84_002877 [Salmonella enterica subsp. enterica serovar Mississippi]|nr:hypothetical protein [Salmonella enterica subsp. enterica]ECW0788934.1 hypothetical protein [Salmonella enterica subsp. enterica]HED0167998.1 hypothetical protein [Salmonella enterica subsp. enterica serovar Mississippi]HED0173862.1 hypothetical protein [Salmonella enterica subsp. enterica serovar Mississippi]HED0195857.1 hypothetical protein [Salmonella enterica subsp. enterica serovar Mississippi]
MKKTVIASVVALSALASGMANAAPNANAGTMDLNFSGTVSTTTCALDPVVNGINGKNDIALGQTEINTKGVDVEVVFKPTAASAASCAGAQSDFVMQWEGVGSAFEANGLKAAAGSKASDSFVQIQATNAKTNNNTMASSEGFQYEFDKDTVAGDGLKYNVALMGGAQVGDMTATAKVQHWYK